ncbi:hypothetical protein N0V82_009301 [Gnomoniopsis sp. IMI 355080]|nr:hypothetical protein N0V82_009301 [Gnomoniopsis sp. IMI 355080]
MSSISRIPQTPPAKAILQIEDSPSSSSGSSIVEEIETQEETKLFQTKNGLLQSEVLVPSLIDLKKGDWSSKQNVSSSPLLIPVDPRSTSPLLHSLPDQVYLSAVSTHGNSSLVTRRLYYKLCHFWTSNRSYLLVIISTFFGSLMSLFTKLLERDGHGMHALQILVLRMTFSWFVCIGCLYYTKRSEFPLGPKNVRWLLLARGAFGFCGIGAFWTALSYLSISDATVITFLTPSMIAGYSAIFLGQPFPKKEMAASFVAMVGVVFIARPVAIFGAVPRDNVPPVAPALGDGHPMTSPSTVDVDAKAAAERLLGIMLCLISAVGGTGALLSVKMIGTRASVLTTTSYFAFISTLISITILTLAPVFDIDQPQLNFALPNGIEQWLYVCTITVCGLATQLLMTLGFGSEGRSNKAPAMLYTGMLWTAGFDRWAFGKEMHWTSIVGICLIVGGALFMALQPKPQTTQEAVVRDEESCDNEDRVLELGSLNNDADQRLT